jgi:hypothetical protein
MEIQYLATKNFIFFLKKWILATTKNFVTKEDTERRLKGLGQNGRIIDDAKSAWLLWC